MNLLDLAVKITCDDQASGQVSGIGSRITGALGTAAKVGVAAVAALGTATVAVGKSALDAFADYEQLVGGIDTLFKNSSSKMQQYAASAYQTAGVSANRYMEISTSFAASLISSLGGDTEAAADMANTAIMDMSDNANKMGTDLEVVQEAYQSLARGNYEMLDSLKLGYGGTKSELERLLSDAEQVAASQGMVRDFSVDSYADVVEAIHLVQGEMGITGTTAEEAASTITGSVNTAKAAWENWLAGLGNEDADMSALTDQLVQSAVTAGENIVPRVQEIFATLGETVQEHAPQAFAGLGEIILDSVPPDVREALLAFWDMLQSVIESVAPIITERLIPAFQTLVSNVAPLIEALTPVAEFLGQVLAIAFTFAVEAINALIVAITTVINWFMNLGTELQNAATAASDFVNNVVTFMSELPGKIAGFLSGVISDLATWATDMWNKAVEAGTGFLSGVETKFNEVVDWFGGLPDKITAAIGDVGNLLWDTGKSIIDGLWGGLKSAWGSVTGWFSSITSQIPSLKGPMDVDRRLLIPNGLAIMGSLLTGLREGFPAVAGELQRITDEIGQHTMQGAALGVDDGAPMLARPTEDAMRGMVGSAASVRASSLAAGPSGPGYAELVGAVESLHADLGKIIRANAPTATPRQFNRMVRAAT